MKYGQLIQLKPFARNFDIDNIKMKQQSLGGNC